jgi:hypothetical protein
MFAYGDQNFAYLDLGPGVDRNYIQAIRTESGIELGELLGLVNSAMGAVNARRDPLVASLVFETTSEVGKTRRTTRKFVQRGGEYTVARPQRGAAAGYMLPIYPHEIGTGFTERGLKRISRDRFNEELNDVVEAWQAIYLGETLERLFSGAEFPVDDGITAATSPGFAGSGTGSNVFSGIFPDGTPIPGGYTHYARIADTRPGLDTGLRTYRNQIKRWHPGPFEMIGTDLGISTLRAQSDFFVEATSNLIAVGANTDRALVDPLTYVGVWDGDVRVRQPVSALGSTNHLAIYKSYGPFATGNPLAWRTYENETRDVRVESRNLYPLAESVSLQDFGVGVSDRVAAALFFLAASGSYTPPVVTF